MKRVDRKWSALIISVFVVLIISIIMIYLLDKLVPISRNVKGIENTNIAYYNAETGVEEALLWMSKTNPWYESGQTVWVLPASWYNYNIRALSSQTPILWEWNSWYDTNWDRLWPWQPMQRVLKNWLFNIWDMTIALKTPNTDWNCSTSIDLSWWVMPIVSWMLTWSWWTLYASWWITANDINDSWKTLVTSDECNPQFWRRFLLTNNTWVSTWLNSWNQYKYAWDWFNLSNSADSFANFYKNILWSDCAWYKCTLKISIINSLISTTWENIPYLEIRFSSSDTSDKFPLQYAILDVDWYSNGFKRHINKDIKQTTTIEALDFTVFQ